MPDEDAKTTEIETSTIELDENGWPYPQGRDWMLARMAWFAGAGWGQDITLSVDGGIITGMLISAHQYFDEMAIAASRAVVTGNDGDAVRNTFVSFYRECQKQSPSMSNTKEALDAPPVNFVHLKNAQWIAGNGRIPSSPTLLWRGRISHISSFSLGRIS